MSVSKQRSWPVYGHEKQVQLLQQACLSNQVAQAYLIYGLRGLGKKHLASLMVKELLCQDKTANCDSCFSCVRLKKNLHPDVMHLPLTSSQSISVDEVRLANQFLHLSALTSGTGRRCLIIDRAERFTDAAANAMLKTLEDPPVGAVIILLAEKISQVPATVRSRCQLIKLLPLSQLQMKSWIKQFNLEPEIEETVLSLSLGRPGRALDLLADNLEQYQLRMERLLSWMSSDPVITFQSLKLWLDSLKKQSTLEIEGQYQDQIILHIDYLELIFRDIILASLHDDLIVNALYRQPIIGLAQRLRPNRVLELMSVLKNLRYNIARNLNVQLSWEQLLLQL